MLTYNHERYILDALNSLLDQEYEKIELIILDDASVDDTPLIIEQYMDKLEDRFVRVEFIKNEKNSGSISQNCNRMMKRMKGEYYFSFSGDDILLPQCIRLLYEKIEEHKECMIIHANVIQVQDTYVYGNEIDKLEIFWKDRESGVESDNFFYQLMYVNRIVAVSVMYRKEVISAYGYHDESIMYEDYEYWLRLSRKEKFYYYNKPVALYRKARTSITNFSENSYSRLKIAINSDYQTKRKYIEQLTEDERIICWTRYYTYYIQMCTQCGYEEGLKWLENKRKEDKIELEESKSDYEKSYKVCCMEAEILSLWIKIKNSPNILGNYLKNRGIYKVAIYGYYSRMADVLQRELLNDGIIIEYIIDRKGRMWGSPFPAYTINNLLPSVDAIIVAPIGLYEEVESTIIQEENFIFIDLKKLIKELAAKKIEY